MNADILLLILGMAVVTYLPRALPLMLLSSRSLHPWLERWLALVPPTVIAAILTQELFIRSDNGVFFLSFGPQNLFIPAAVPAFLVAWLTRSFLGTVAAGMGSLAILRLLFT